MDEIEPTDPSSKRGENNHFMIELSNSECKECVYKFVCLGGCPLGARAKGEEMTCGIFEEEEILYNLEFDYSRILKYRSREKIHEIEEYTNHYDS